MFSDKFAKPIAGKIAGLALVGAALALPGAAFAGVVVKSSGPSADTYPVGKKVEDTSTITLRAGDKVTVLVDGGTRVLQGPGSFRVGEGATKTRARFANLTRKNASTRVRTGAVRGTGGEDAGPKRQPNLWYVDVGQGGTVCLYDLQSVRLWRADDTTGQIFTVTDSAAGASVDVAFVETEAVRSLDPSGLMVKNGGSYTITGPAGSAPAVNVTFVALPQEYEAPDALAEALITNGCMTQLSVLADTLEDTVE